LDDYRRPEASEHYERAIALERVGRIDEALAEYRRAVDLDPGFAAAYEALGYHYQRRGLLMKALDAFETVARLEGNYTTHFNEGYILVELERYEEALESFQRCLALASDDPAALYEIGYVSYILQRLPLALEALRIPLQAYAEDWRVHNLAGACNIGLERWVEAEACYRRALEVATSAEEVEEAQAGLLIAQRYQEFPAGTPLGFKERAYADAGAIVLGTAGDDGLVIPPCADLSPAAIAVTLRRLVVLVRALDLALTAVVAVDRASIPVAAVLARMLDLPRRQLSQLARTDHALLVLAVGRQAEFLQVALEQAPPGTRSFVFALGWYGEHDLLPDLIGVPLPDSLARQVQEPAGTEPQDQQSLLEALLAASAVAPAGPDMEAQVRYYTVEHRRLRCEPGARE
jgi:Flp pilus assembly protein TadD